MEKRNIFRQTCLVLAALAAFFVFLFYVDNKYQTPPPYGRAGVIELDGQDFKRGTPVFLIDGWLLTDGRVTDMPTYIHAEFCLCFGVRASVGAGGGQ